MIGDTMASGSILEKSITETSDGDLMIPVIGIPFVGPVDGRLDLVGDYFDKSTDLGPLETVMVFWDHGHDEIYMRSELKSLGYSDEQIDAFGHEVGFGRQHIGVAQKSEVLPEGVVYNIIINRRTRYKRILERAAKEGLLSVSSKALFREDDSDHAGRIKYWPVAAIDLTPTPANPEAKLLLKSLMEDDMPSEVEEVAVQEEAPAPVSETHAEQPPAQTPITDAIRAVEQSAADPGSEAAIAPESPVVEKSADPAVSAGNELAKSVGERMDALEAKVDGMLSQFQALQKAIVELDANTSKTVQDLNADLQIALPELARQITKALRADVQQEVRKSRAETQIETEKSAAAAPATMRKYSPENAAVIASWPGR